MLLTRTGFRWRPWDLEAGGPPEWPWELNEHSWQFNGLKAFWPLVWMPGDAFDVIGRFHLTQNGPVWIGDAEIGAVPELVRTESDHFKTGSPLLTATPFTVACWARITVSTVDSHFLWAIGDSTGAGAADNWSLIAAGASPFIIVARAASGGSVADAETTTGYQDNTWHHMCGVFAASNDRRVYLDGGGKGTNTIDKTPSTLDRTIIGARHDLTNFLNGRELWVCVWDRALSDDEVTLLVSPHHRWDLVRPWRRRRFSLPVVEITGLDALEVASSELGSVLPTLVGSDALALLSAEAVDRIEATLAVADIAQVIASTVSALLGFPDVAETAALSLGEVTQLIQGVTGREDSISIVLSDLSSLMALATGTDTLVITTRKGP